jgi:hypothetical protein
MSSSLVRWALVVSASVWAVLACSSSEDDPLVREEAGCGVTDFSICGFAFDEISDEVGRPAYTSPFGSALDRWDSDAMCEGVAQRGRCADGKDFLYWKLGEAAEVRYYDDEGRPIAVALLREASTCGDPCPRESFYGAFEDVLCEAPDAGPVCGPFIRISNADLPFSEAAPLNACEECASP